MLSAACHLLHGKLLLPGRWQGCWPQTVCLQPPCAPCNSGCLRSGQMHKQGMHKQGMHQCHERMAVSNLISRHSPKCLKANCDKWKRGGDIHDSLRKAAVIAARTLQILALGILAAFTGKLRLVAQVSTTKPAYLGLETVIQPLRLLPLH